MFWLNSCLRCQGDLSGKADRYGGFVHCLQCGHYLTEAEEANLRAIAKPKPSQGGKSAIPLAMHLKIPPARAA